MRFTHPAPTVRRLAFIALAMVAVVPARVRAASERPVQVYVMVGQSNMQGKGGIEGEETTTLRHLVQNDPQKEFQFLVREDGEWVEREDVWIYLDQ